MNGKHQNEAELINSVRFIIQSSCKYKAFPENVSFSVDNEGRTTLCIRLAKPQFGEMLIQYVLPENELAEMSKECLISFCQDLPVQNAIIAAIAFISWQIVIFLSTFLLEMEHSFNGLWDISNLLYSKAEKQGKVFENLSREDQTNLANEFAKKRATRAKQVFEKFKSERNENIHRWDSLQHILSLFYRLLLPEWKKAKSCYNQNRKHADWHKRVDPLIDIHLPPDLLEKLSKKGENEPSFLAAQHAARICLMPDKGRFSIKDPRGYKSRIAQSSKWIKENPQQAAELVKSVVKRISRFRMQPIFRQIWENQDFFLENGVPRGMIMPYLDEFFFLTKDKILTNIRGEMFLASISILEGFEKK